MKKGIIGLILVISFVIQLAFVLTVHTLPESDMKGYDERGMLFAEQQSFDYGGQFNGATYRPPMYILFLAGIYSIFGHHYLAVYIIQAILSVFCLFLINRITSRLWNERVGLVALILSALYVPFIGYSGIILSEILFLFFLLVSVYYGLRAIQTGAMLSVILSGVASALAALTRSISLLLPICIVLLLMIYFPRKVFTKASMSRILIFFIAMFLTISPWTIRNYMDTKEFVLIDSISGLNMLIGNNEYATGFFTTKVWETEGWKEAHQPHNNLPQADRIMKQHALQWIQEHPNDFLQLTLKRFDLYFDKKTDWFTEDYGWNNILFNKMNFEAHYHEFLFICFIMGLLLIRKRQPQLVFLALIVLYFIGINSLFYVSPRYRLPAMPFMLMYCSYVVYWVLSMLGKLVHRSSKKNSTRTGELN